MKVDWGNLLYINLLYYIWLMEDVLEGIVVPEWNIWSALLLVLLIAGVIMSILTLVESIKWLVSAIRNKAIKKHTSYILWFVLLLITSAQRGYAYLSANACWVITLLKLDKTPNWDVLQYGCIIQESIKLEVLRAASHAILYTVSFLIIRKSRKANFLPCSQ